MPAIPFDGYTYDNTNVLGGVLCQGVTGETNAESEGVLSPSLELDASRGVGVTTFGLGDGLLEVWKSRYQYQPRQGSAKRARSTYKETPQGRWPRGG